MASTTTQPAARLQVLAPTNPLAAWHLLSLDAPTVAALWTSFAARANGLHLAAAPVTAMFLAVWTLYAADRLLDSRTLAHPATPHTTQNLEARHLFHHTHRRGFVTLIAASLLVLATLIPRLNPEALKLFLAEGLVLALWFGTLHCTSFAGHLPKELALGPFFAAAVFIPTFARLHPAVPALPQALLFAALCSLNCLFIHRWETAPYSTAASHPSTLLAARYARPLNAALILLSTALAISEHSPQSATPAACALAALILLILDVHRTRAHLHRITLRAAADAALLTPILFLLFSR